MRPTQRFLWKQPQVLSHEEEEEASCKMLIKHVMAHVEALDAKVVINKVLLISMGSFRNRSNR